MIPKEKIDEVLGNIDIVEVISARTPLKKAGKNFKACCPFHEEKTPSFNVSEDKQMYYCFGCGASGDAIGFVVEYDNISFPEAVKLLAKRAGVSIEESTPERSKDERKHLSDIYNALEKAANKFVANREEKNNPMAVLELAGRGLTEETIKKFRIGVAQDGWNDVVSEIGGVKKASLLSESGLAVHRPKDEAKGEKFALYDRFRNGIIFPITNAKGSVISFARRKLSTGDEQQKYLNGPETTVFKKNQHLYGLSQAKSAPKPLTDRVIVTEGYMDVAMSHQHGFTETVATMGTAISEGQLSTLSRQTNQIVFVFDGDTAGRQASVRAMENALPMMGSETELRFLLLPKGEDPDSIIQKHGGEHYEKIVNEQSIPYSQFMLGFCRNHIDLNSDEGRSIFFDRATGYLDRMPATPFKCRLSQRVSEISGIKISETLPISMNIVPNADVFDVAGTVSRIAAEQLGLPVDSIRIDITPPKLQPSKMPVIESFENIEPSEELRSRAVMISKALKLDMTVIQGHTLDSLYRSACQSTDETKNIAKSVITDFLSKSNLFETQCQQTVVHLRAMRDCISESIERNEVTPELATELGGWINRLKDNSGIYRSIIDLSGDAGAKQAVYASCESIKQICTEFSSDLKMSVAEKMETNPIIQEDSIISR